MKKSLTFHLETGEEVLEQDKILEEGGVVKFASLFSVMLTNKRVIFRYSGIATGYSLYFTYEEIQEVTITRRLFVDYILVKTKDGGEYVVNAGNPKHWAARIMESREQFSSAEEKAVEELTLMLETLWKNGLLTPEEMQEKKERLMSGQKRVEPASGP